VHIEADALPGTTLEGKVERISPTVQQETASATVQVSLKVPDSDTRWKPGMSVRVQFLAKE
jgi:multidrug efflux pump subunit AcrA (membrane-fusion protein)